MNHHLNIWLSIVAVSLTGILTRISLLVLPESIRLPARVERGLRFAPAAALAAITAPAVLLQQGQWRVEHNPVLWAALVTAVTMAWRKNMVLALFSGVLMYTACRLVF